MIEARYDDADDGRSQEGLPPRPMAGHRSLAALTLVFGSVAPIMFGSVIIWTALDVPNEPYAFLVIVLGGLVGMALPYAVGWLRSLLAMLLVCSLARLVPYWLPDLAIVWQVLLATAGIAAVAALTWLSLRLGHVRRPKDATTWRAAKGDTFPYPYF